MFTNNNFYGNAGVGFGAPQQGYGNFGAPVGAFQTQANPMALFRGGNSTLTKEEVQSMRNQGFNLWDVSDAELLKAMCNHYDTDGNIALVPDGNGTYECTVCHAKGIKVIKSLKYESVKKAVENIIDIINSVKVLHFHQNKDVMRGIYQIIPILERFPEAYKIAVSDFNSVVKNMNNYMQPANGYYNNPAAACTSPGIMNMYTGGYGAASMYGQQPQQYGMMGGNNNCYQNQGMMTNYYGQQQPQNGFAPGFNAGPAPIGGMQNTMQSQFVQGGVVPQPTNPAATPAGNGVPSVASYFENVNNNNAAAPAAAPTTASYQPANATGETAK
jgi:hypothetical protein